MSEPTLPDGRPIVYIECPLCHYKTFDVLWQDHLKSDMHLEKVKLWKELLNI